MFSSFDEVKRTLDLTKDRIGVLLLTETSACVPKVKPGLPALAYRVLDETTAENGPLADVLRAFTSQRPRTFYTRLLLDRKDTKVMTHLGVCWLPQIRVVKNGRVLFRSSVSIGDNGSFLTQDVGGRSFIRRVEPGPGDFIDLVDSLTAEIDRPHR